MSHAIILSSSSLVPFPDLMETPTAIPAIPRLRVSRQHQSTLYEFSDSQNISQADPSRPRSSTHLMDSYIEDSGEAEQQDTPKISAFLHLPTETFTSPEDTPAARLKAVLERTSAKSKPPPPPLPSSGSVTESESDLEIPEMGSSQPSLARVNLNSLFTHALRDPGDTPQKSAKGKMRRRNSVDTSEFESSPRVVEVEKDRSDYKGKRRSTSDDELSVSNISVDRSQAEIFDTLRQRLDSGKASRHSDKIDQDESADTLKFPKDMDSSQYEPPVATSTPQHSLKMSVNSQTNLMDQDSEMQRLMKDLDSYESSLPAGPPDTSHISKAATHGSTNRNADGIHASDPRSVHSNSGTDLLSPSHSGRARDRSREPAIDPHEREREWNKNHSQLYLASSNMKHRHSLHDTPPEAVSSTSSNQGQRPPYDKSSTSIHFENRPLSRNGSRKSVNRNDDAPSNAGSTSSHNDYHQLLREREQERNAKLEHDWSKSPRSIPRPLSMPNASPLSPPERSRITSFSSRPSSRLSALSPQPSPHHHHSRSSSGASSPTGSLFSLNSNDEGKAEVDHERERNWNAPKPSWHQHPSSHRSPSSVDTHSPSAERVRTISLPSRPGSDISTSSPHTIQQRHDSRSSSRSSSRASSSGGSLLSLSGNVDVEELHEQERNWNSPRPHWRLNNTEHGHSRSHTPSSTLKRTQSLTQKPLSPSPVSSTSMAHFSIDTSASARRRAESLKASKTPSLHPSSSVHQKESLQLRVSGSSSPSTKRPSLSSHRPNTYPARPDSPLPPITNNGISRSQSKTEIPRPFPSPSHSSQAKFRSTPSPELSRKVSSPSPSLSSHRPSHIPVRSSTKHSEDVQFPAPVNSYPPQEAELRIPNILTKLAENEELDEQGVDSDSTDTDTEPQDDIEELAQESTPTLGTNGVHLPPETPEHSASLETEARLQKIIASPPSPPLSSPSDGPSTPEAETPQFFLPLTPPRKDSFSSVRQEFQTPSPPKNFPDLPGPPSTPSENDDPVPAHRNLSSMKTPRPPGAWTMTPAPRTTPLLRSSSLPTDDEYDSGLATPAASLSRAATLPPQTPALPGGWLNTPANRKSVRFHEESLMESEQSTVEHTATKVKDESVETSPILDTPPSPDASKAVASTFNGSSPSRRSPRKAATIRVVDSFGREDKKKDDTSRNNSIRVVDAMGRVVEDSIDSSPSALDGVPPTRNEALGRVRTGLHELVEELKGEERLLRGTSEDDRERIQKLEWASNEAREFRMRLNSEMFANAENIKTKLAPLRASMQRSASFVPNSSRRRSSRWSWLIWGFVQFLIILIIYRAARSYAKNMFLTTYYDPLYPDLFFYTSLPTNYCSSPSALELFRNEGLKAAALQILEYMSLMFSSWRFPCQHILHHNAGRIWPPT